MTETNCMGFNGEETSWQESLECKSTESASVLGLYTPTFVRMFLWSRYCANFKRTEQVRNVNLPLTCRCWWNEVVVWWARCRECRWHRTGSPLPTSRRGFLAFRSRENMPRRRRAGHWHSLTTPRCSCHLQSWSETQWQSNTPILGYPPN